MPVHPIPPVYNEDSEILILGSFPSVKSREEGFFYGHPRNRFWKILSAIYDEKTPETIEEKKAFLLKNHIAVWDVIRSCDIRGSSDASIRNVLPNDISSLLKKTKIQKIYVNGKTAEKLYRKYLEDSAGKAQVLPSSSPANAGYSLERLIEEWRRLLSEDPA
ncbi:MAG: DNA-deoxyinosine glycosylase [Erysipelotrichaceae bacterium]|nr:DNA-deoxyinosine glycosylase [Erysipelotrichaceae bacterium]